MDSSCSATGSHEKLIGVAIRDFTDDGLTALKWASEFLRQPNRNYKLCVILIKLVANKDPCVNEEYTWDEIERRFIIKDADDECKIEKFQEIAKVFAEKMCLRICTGKSIQEALRHAIEKLDGIDTLVVGGPRIVQSQIELELSGCSIVHVMKKDTHARTTLSRLPAAPQAMLSSSAAADPSAQLLAQAAQPEGGAPQGQVRRETNTPGPGNAES